MTVRNSTAIALLACLVAVPSLARAEGAKAALPDPVRDTFEPSLAKMKAKLPCKAGWKATPGRTPAGKSYTVEICGDANQQLMVDGGKVFAVGLALVNHTDSRTADRTMKEWSRDLAAQCTEKRRAGQMAMYVCPANLMVVLLFNWNSKDDTHTVSTLFGDATKLGTAIGVK